MLLVGFYVLLLIGGSELLIRTCRTSELVSNKIPQELGRV